MERISTTNANNPKINELSVIGEDATEEETNAYYLEQKEKTQYRNIPPWERQITDSINQSIWYNDYFIKFLEYRDPFNISKNTTELSNGIRYAAEAKNFLIYDISDKPQGRRQIPRYFWRSWTGTYWKPAVWEPQRTAKLIVKEIEEEIKFYSEQAKKHENESLTKKEYVAACKILLEHYNNSTRKIGIKHMIDLSESEPGISADINEIYDRNLIGCNNGVIDTKNAIFYSIDNIPENIKNSYPIHHINCNYIENGKHPKKFIDFLFTIFTDNITKDIDNIEIIKRCKESIQVLLRLLGYSLIAGNPERKILFLWGKGRNGKSTLAGLLLEILGDEFGEGSSNELYTKNGDSPAPRITEALNRRIMYFAEITDADENDRNTGLISLDVVKLITGEASTNQFRGMGTYDGRKDILCLPIAATNNFPQFNKTPDTAFLDRIITVPFLHRLTEEEKDTNIREKILKEKDLIFTLLVNECFIYRKGVMDKYGLVIQKPGLLPIPKYWGNVQTKIMVGSQLYEYISKRFVKSEDQKSLDFTSIKNDYIHWLLKNKAEDPKPYKDELHGYDSQNQHPVFDIKKGDKNKLKKALTIFGFEAYKSHNNTYYNAALSKEALNEWDPNPQF